VKLGKPHIQVDDHNMPNKTWGDFGSTIYVKNNNSDMYIKGFKERTKCS
jgi:hypothetical protein